jgi:hypothetical protein
MDLAATWRATLAPGRAWVAFANGTCVVLKDPKDARSEAIELLRRYGPVAPGGPSADFGTITLDDGRGWVVTGHHPDILVYVAPEEAPGAEIGVGLLGRAKRAADAEELEVVHVQR